MTERRVDPVAAARARLRASDADRERAIEALKAAFTGGRLTYVMAMMVAAANVVAARFDDGGRRTR